MISDTIQITSAWVVTASTDRYNRFVKHDKNRVINKFDAIMTTVDHSNILKDRGFTADFSDNISKTTKAIGHDGKILNESWYDHFSKCPGAYGCFMSHHTIWQQIKTYDNYKNTWFMVVEDDVVVEDVVEFINQPSVHENTQYELINLIKSQCDDMSKWWLIKGDADSTAAYVIKGSMVDRLLNFNPYIISYPLDKHMFKMFPERMNYEHLVSRVESIRLSDLSEQCTMT